MAFVLRVCAGDSLVQQPEALNKKALAIITRVREKLTGHDFDKNVGVSVEKQVELLIKQATSNENLCQCYIGWYVIWISFLICMVKRRGRRDFELSIGRF